MSSDNSLKNKVTNKPFSYTHTYIVIHRQICFVLSELISVAR